MKALILAAGMGTRLKGLTEKRPKALVPVAGIPAVARNIEFLKSFGVRHIGVNAHHHYRQLVDYLGKGAPFGIELEVRIEEEILGTGGGIQNFSDFFTDAPFIVINADVLTDIDLARAYDRHLDSANIATMILHDHAPFNQVMIKDSHVVDISRQEIHGRLAFTGIHIIDPLLLSHIPASGYSDIIDCYKGLISSGSTIGAYVSQGHYWRDIGSPESYLAANREFLGGSGQSFLIGPGAEMAPSVGLRDWVVAGKDVVLEHGVEIARSVLWDNVTVKEGVSVIDSVVTSSRVVDHDLKGEIY